MPRSLDIISAALRANEKTWDCILAWKLHFMYKSQSDAQSDAQGEAQSDVPTITLGLICKI